MFQGLINSAKSAASSLILKYVARASVAIPFVIALGFALAAVTTMLVNEFGYVTGYLIMAGGLAVIGAIAAAFVSAKEEEEKIEDLKAEKEDTTELASEVAAQAPLALLGAMFTAPGGATTALKTAQLLGRNFPLVLLLVLIGALFWPSASPEEQGDLEDLPLAPGPNGLDPTSPGSYTH